MNTLYRILYMVIKVRLLIVCVTEVCLPFGFAVILAGQVDTLPVRSTKASELNANGACSALSGDGEYELVRGRGASENTEFNFSNPLYAEPERVIACEIYESVSTSRSVVDDLGTSCYIGKTF